MKQGIISDSCSHLHIYVENGAVTERGSSGPVTDCSGIPSCPLTSLGLQHPMGCHNYLYPCPQCRNLSQSPFQGSDTLRWATSLLFPKQKVLLHKAFNTPCGPPSYRNTLFLLGLQHCIVLHAHPLGCQHAYSCSVFVSSSTEMESLQKHPASTMFQCLGNWKDPQGPFSLNLMHDFSL